MLVSNTGLNMTADTTKIPYFDHLIQIDASCWQRLDLAPVSHLVTERSLPQIVVYRHLAAQLNAGHSPAAPPVSAAQLQLYATLLTVYRYLIDVVASAHTPDPLADALRRSGGNPHSSENRQLQQQFVAHFPPGIPGQQGRADQWLHDQAAGFPILMREMLLLRLAQENRALDPFRELCDDAGLRAASKQYGVTFQRLEKALHDAPHLPELGMALIDALRAPLRANPASLADQLGYIRSQWEKILPPEVLEEVAIAFDSLREEERQRGGGGGEPPLPPVLQFGSRGQAGAGQGGHAADGGSIFGGYDYPEHEAFSQDADWMPNVVLLAKMVYVWLDQLSCQYGYPITRLDQIPEAELATLARRGFTGLWLIGIWERSPASRRIKELCGNPDAIASAYSLYDYEIAADLGGWEALANFRQRAQLHGIRLASDMVPNHTGIYSRWVRHHPDWFVQTDYLPFPTYRFEGENLSTTDDAVIQLEDGYWTKTEAAVVFRMIERSTGRTRYIYHGNDGTSIPWNDTAQLNYLLPEVREAVIQTILHVARNFPIIRFDAAMTLAKKHYQRLWFPLRGLGGGIPSRAEHGMSRDEFDAVFPVEFWREVVDRVAVEAPGTLLLAEAFWMMEGYFVRTLGMHRVYNSAFMNMLMKEENAKYRQTIKNVVAFNPEVLQRFVNFMNNPDEKTAAEQFGSQGKYFGSCLLLATMPGLPMFGHGQVEGFHEKYGMEYKRAYWNEPVDQGLVQGHEMWIFPILRKRWLFSGAVNFALYDFVTASGVDEHVYAYSNRCGDERVLVLYHNRYASTAGWIRESSPIAISGGDDPETATVTLASALAISAAPDRYYAFHDHTRNLEYLRSGKELHDAGLYAELGEYEFHIFGNFRELCDTAELPWGALCADLQGRGVENLEDEMKQFRYPEINRAFHDLLMLAAVPVASWQHLMVDHFGEPLAGAFSTSDGIRIVLAALLLADLPEGGVELFGLDTTLSKAVTQELSGRGSQLVAALCTMQPFNPETMFSSPAPRSYLQVHTSEGVEWFNKERFEELLAWGMFTARVIARGKITPAWIRSFKKIYTNQCLLAAHSGYRTALMAALLTDPQAAECRVAAAPTSLGKVKKKAVEKKPRLPKETPQSK